VPTLSESFGDFEQGTLGHRSAVQPQMRTAPLLLALLLAGCARVTPAGPAAPPDSPVSSTPGTSPAPGPTALPVSPRPGLVDVRPHIWDRVEILGPRTLRLEFYGGIEECEGVDRVEVDQAPHAVTVTLFVGRVPTAEACIEIAVLKSIEVELEEPLAGREVVDGAAGT